MPSCAELFTLLILAQDYFLERVFPSLAIFYKYYSDERNALHHCSNPIQKYILATTSRTHCE